MCTSLLLTRGKRKRKKKKGGVKKKGVEKVLDTFNNESKILKRKFYSQYEDKKKRYIIMTSATFNQLLVLLGSSLTFQGTKLRESLPPKERLAVILRWSWRIYGRRAQNVTRQSLLSQFLYFFCTTTVSVLEEYVCVYTHTHICVVTVYELPLLPNNTAVKHLHTDRSGTKR